MSDTGFQPGQPGITQGGFQEQFNVLLTDIGALKQTILNAQWQINLATSVLQKSELTPGFWQGGRDTSGQDQGFQPPDQQRVTLLQNDIASLKNSIFQAKDALDQANAIVQKQDFGPGFWQSGFQ